ELNRCAVGTGPRILLSLTSFKRNSGANILCRRARDNPVYQLHVLSSKRQPKRLPRSATFGCRRRGREEPVTPIPANGARRGSLARRATLATYPPCVQAGRGALRPHDGHPLGWGTQAGEPGRGHRLAESDEGTGHETTHDPPPAVGIVVPVRPFGRASRR